MGLSLFSSTFAVIETTLPFRLYLKSVYASIPLD
jgi:hypothetical protein